MPNLSQRRAKTSSQPEVCIFLVFIQYSSMHKTFCLCQSNVLMVGGGLSSQERGRGRKRRHNNEDTQESTQSSQASNELSKAEMEKKVLK